MKKLILLLTIVSLIGAPAISLLDLQRLTALAPNNTNVVVFAGVPTSDTTSTPYKLQLTQGNLETLLNITFATDAELAAKVDATSINTLSALQTYIATDLATQAELDTKQDTLSVSTGLEILLSVLHLRLQAGTNVVLTTNDNNIIINSASPGIPGGSSGDIQYNNAGAFAGAPLVVTAVTNITASGIVSGYRFSMTDTSSATEWDFFDLDQSHKMIVAAENTISTSGRWYLPIAPFSGIPKYTITGGTNMTQDAAVVNTDYVTPASQAGTHSTPATGNPLSPTWTSPVHVVWYGATGTINLPAVSGYQDRAILIYNTGAFTITVEPNGSEIIVRDGAVQTGGVNMTLSSGAGNYVWIIGDGNRWVTLGYKGTLNVGS